MPQQPFRLPPKLPVHKVKTYSVKAPLATHTRAATCEEVDCAPYLHGWDTIIPAGSDHERTLRRAGRPFTEHRDAGPGLIRFHFEPGTKCFRASEHRIQIRRATGIVRDGDWRGNPTGRRRVHDTLENWAEDFAQHQERLADAQR